MAIEFHEESKTFHIYNKNFSYIICVMENGQMENLYYGKRIHDNKDYSYLHEEIIRSLMTVCVPKPGFLSMQYTKQEYPVYGNGDFRSPALTVRQENGSEIVDFKYISYHIYGGKKKLEGLPATYTENEEEAQSLDITLHDSVMDTDLILTYTVYENYPVLTRSARVVQKGNQKIRLESALSMSVEFPDMEYEMIQLSGAWARERYVKTRKLEMGIQAVQSLMGCASSSEQNPFIALKRTDATEDIGEVFGFSFVYSGNFLAQVEVSTYEMTRVMMGINPQGFSWELKKGEDFQTPEVVMVYSDKGLNGMSQAYHRLYRDRLMRGKWRNQARPILINNWEATYFDFDEEKILGIAKKAKEVGVELFVLDDGWFGTRDDDSQGLGDWFANKNKLPEGISGLSRKIEDLGMKFGLWVELEMVNKNSECYRAHPDWLISAPDRFQSHSRHQYILDFSRTEVVDFIYESISKVMEESSISYIKWDMNRYMSEPYSNGAAATDQGKTMHRYILGVYELYRRLTEQFPDVLFESCASGGARFDPGMLYFAPQTWTSDDTDAAEREKIQYGTSFVYPLISMGAHVSAVPNHQMHRITPLSTRANVAYFGTFGYELDLNLLSEDETEEVKAQIRFMKKYRELIQVEGDFYRISSPFEGNETAWIVVSPDKKRAVAGYYERLKKINAAWMRMKFKGLNEDLRYNVKWEKNSIEAYGDQLMYAGIPVDRDYCMKTTGDFYSILYIIESCED